MIIVESQAVGPFFKNGFVVSCPNSREAVLIDPGDEVPALLSFISREKLSVAHILLTHAHVDHVTGVAAAKRALGSRVHLHKDDLFLYERAVEFGAMFGLRVEPQPPIDEFYQQERAIPFGEYEARPFHTPGHCPGGVCLQIRRRNGLLGDRSASRAEAADEGSDLFVGDTLFAGSVGRTDLPGGDHATLMQSIRTVLFAFGDEARVYPGHGETTTIGRERRTNPFLTGQA